MNLTTISIITTAELLLLYLLSRKITKSIYLFFYLLTRSKTVSVTLLSAILLPGTVIHELAHLIVAEILRVPTGELSFYPKIEKLPNGKLSVKGGTLKIAKTDPFRRYFIGFAPVFIGLIALTILTYLGFQFIPGIVDLRLRIFAIIGTAYLAFAFSNTMFASPQDLQGFVAFAPILLLIAAISYVLGVRISLTSESLEMLVDAVKQLAIVLSLVLTTNIVVLGTTQGLLTLWQKVFNVTIK